MSIFVFTDSDTSWYGQTGPVHIIIESTRKCLREFGDCVERIYRPLDLEGQVFIDLSDVSVDCFNYFFAMSHQALIEFPRTVDARRLDSLRVDVVVATWEELLEFLGRDERFNQERVDIWDPEGPRLKNEPRCI